MPTHGTPRFRPIILRPAVNRAVVSAPDRRHKSLTFRPSVVVNDNRGGDGEARDLGQQRSPVVRAVSWMRGQPVTNRIGKCGSQVGRQVGVRYEALEVAPVGVVIGYLAVAQDHPARRQPVINSGSYLC